MLRSRPSKTATQYRQLQDICFANVKDNSKPDEVRIAWLHAYTDLWRARTDTAGAWHAQALTMARRRALIGKFKGKAKPESGPVADDEVLPGVDSPPAPHPDPTGD